MNSHIEQIEQTEQKRPDIIPDKTVFLAAKNQNWAMIDNIHKKQALTKEMLSYYEEHENAISYICFYEQWDLLTELLNDALITKEMLCIEVHHQEIKAKLIENILAYAPPAIIHLLLAKQLFSLNELITLAQERPLEIKTGLYLRPPIAHLMEKYVSKQDEGLFELILNDCDQRYTWIVLRFNFENAVYNLLHFLLKKLSAAPSENIFLNYLQILNNKIFQRVPAIWKLIGAQYCNSSVASHDVIAHQNDPYYQECKVIIFAIYTVAASGYIYGFEKDLTNQINNRLNDIFYNKHTYHFQASPTICDLIPSTSKALEKCILVNDLINKFVTEFKKNILKEKVEAIFPEFEEMLLHSPGGYKSLDKNNGLKSKIEQALHKCMQEFPRIVLTLDILKKMVKHFNINYLTKYRLSNLTGISKANIKQSMQAVLSLPNLNDELEEKPDIKVCEKKDSINRKYYTFFELELPAALFKRYQEQIYIENDKQNSILSELQKLSKEKLRTNEQLALLRSLYLIVYMWEIVKVSALAASQLPIASPLEEHRRGFDRRISEFLANIISSPLSLDQCYTTSYDLMGIETHHKLNFTADDIDAYRQIATHTFLESVYKEYLYPFSFAGIAHQYIDQFLMPEAKKWRLEKDLKTFVVFISRCYANFMKDEDETHFPYESILPSFEKVVYMGILAYIEKHPDQHLNYDTQMSIVARILRDRDHLTPAHISQIIVECLPKPQIARTSELGLFSNEAECSMDKAPTYPPNKNYCP